MEDYPYELFWEGGDSAGEYRTQEEAVQAVAAMVARGGGTAAVDQLVLAKLGAKGDVLRLADGAELAALAQRPAGSLRRTA